MSRAVQIQRPPKARAKLKQIDEWRVLDRRVVGIHDGRMLVWLLVVEDDGTTNWKPYYLAEDGTTVLEEPVFCPLPGSQYVFLSSPIFETAYFGNRGGGKSDSLLLDFASGVGKGYGKGWRGVLFRKEFGDLDDIVRKVETIFPKIYGEENFRFLKSKSEYTAVWKTGEALLLRNLPNEDAYREYHGHCVDEGDVLTPEGWRDIRTMEVGDLVYTFDADGEMMPTVVESAHSEDYDGDLIRREDAGLYMSFTPSHKLPLAWPNGQNVLVPFDQMKGQGDVLRSIVRWEGAAPKLGFKPDALAWWLACGRHKNGRPAVITCSYRVARAWQDAGISVQDLDKVSRMPRRVPRELLDAPPDTLRGFLSILIAASGIWRKPSTEAVFRTGARGLADDVCEIGVKLGFNVSMKVSSFGAGGSYEFINVTLTPGKPTRLYTGRGEGGFCNVKRVPFKGKVYCIGVPLTHTFIIRQRGCVWLSGNSYAWIGFEELTQWPDDKAYRLMFSCARSPAAGVPVRGIRSTSNPYGIGHNWVKKRFRLPQGFGKVIRMPREAPRVAIQSDLRENFVLLHTNPNYPNLIRQAASNPAQEKAWIDGDWNVTTGGMFDDLWDTRTHIIPSVHPGSIPLGWKLNRSYDHGSAKPFCVLWWAESNGEPAHLPDGRTIGQVPGDLLLFAEWYGTTGEADVGVRMTASKIAQGIVDRQRDWRISHRVRVGPADANIYSKETTQGTNRSPADDMEAAGVLWTPADMSAGSRKRGYQMIRARLSASRPNVDGTREFPGLFVCERCLHWLELVPSAPRSTEDQDELPKKYEDHPVDATRYRVSHGETETWQRGF